jgi:hypothetical protein
MNCGVENTKIESHSRKNGINISIRESSYLNRTDENAQNKIIENAIQNNIRSHHTDPSACTDPQPSRD